jgi:hypothetical protein
MRMWIRALSLALQHLQLRVCELFTDGLTRLRIFRPYASIFIPLSRGECDERSYTNSG